jgi:outer membrane scaffolding protein for murein synthesis (MipA/OmpV family)
MTIWKAIPLVTAMAVATAASVSAGVAAGANPFLQGGSGGGGTHYQGSAKEQAACRPDVRRYCSSIKPDADSGQFLHCLQANRSKLSKACLGVLTSHGV